MKNIYEIDFMDFYFNGHYLSEFGGFIGGTEGLSQYPLLPSRNYTTDRAIGQDGVTVFNSYLEPRTFEVPICFEDIDYAGIRTISGWLNTKSDEWFYFKGDTLKIKCTLDTSGTNLELLGIKNDRYGCQTSLKFIAHDPYYYEIEDTIYEYKNLTLTSNSFPLVNNGNEESFPIISIWGDNTITINVYKGTSELHTSCVITGLITGVQLDTKYRTCLTQAGAQMFNNFSGEFPRLPAGNYRVEILGKISKVTIQPRFRYV